MKFKSLNILLIFNILLLSISLVLKKSNNNILYGKVIVIDPGHGGNDNGAEVNNVLEDEINLNIAKLLYQKLFDQGCIVHITRVGDYDLAPQDSQTRKMKDLKRRTRFINEVDADLFISIHLNSYPSENVSGPMVYYKKDNEVSYELGCSILNKLNLLTDNKKKVKTDDFYLFKYTDIPGVIVECGFITNSKERELLLDNRYQNMISKAIFEWIRKI